MGAQLTVCTMDDSFSFGCVANNDHGTNEEADVGDVYPSMDSIYPLTSTATILQMHEPQFELQSPMGSPGMSLWLKRRDSVVHEGVVSPQARSVGIISPLSMASPNHAFCYNDGESSDTQSVMSVVSPTKDRRFAPLYLRIPILRPAGLHQPATIPDTNNPKPYYEQGHVEKFFDAPMFEAKEALFTAILCGDLTAVQDAVEQLLPPVFVSRITWPEHRDDNALHLAVRNGHLPIVQYLLMKMDNALNARNEDGESALSLAGSLRQYEILAYLMRWIVDNSRRRHSEPADDANLVSPYSPYASSSFQLQREEKESKEGGDDDVMSVLSVLMTSRSVATVDEDHQKSDPKRVSDHLSRIFNEEEVMAWLTQLEEGVTGEGIATSETEGDDRQSLASTPSTSRLTMTDTAPYNNSTVPGKAAGRKLPLPRGVRKAAGRAFRQIGRMTAMLPRANQTQHI